LNTGEAVALIAVAIESPCGELLGKMNCRCEPSRQRVR